MEKRNYRDLCELSVLLDNIKEILTILVISGHLFAGGGDEHIIRHGLLSYLYFS